MKSQLQHLMIYLSLVFLLLSSTYSCTSVRSSSSTPSPTLTPPSTSTSTSTVAALAISTWASDASGKVDLKKMYPLVGAINYQHHKVIDLEIGSLRLAVVTNQDVSKLDASAQKVLRAEVAARFEQNNEVKNALERIREKLIRLHPSATNFYIIIDGEKPTQAIADSDGNLARYYVDTSGNLSRLEAGFRLLPALYVDGGFIKREDTGEIVQLKGVDIPNRLDATWAQDNLYSFGLMAIAKQWGAN